MRVTIPSTEKNALEQASHRNLPYIELKASSLISIIEINLVTAIK